MAMRQSFNGILIFNRSFKDIQCRDKRLMIMEARSALKRRIFFHSINKMRFVVHSPFDTKNLIIVFKAFRI